MNNLGSIAYNMWEVLPASFDAFSNFKRFITSFTLSQYTYSIVFSLLLKHYLPPVVLDRTRIASASKCGWIWNFSDCYYVFCEYSSSLIISNGLFDFLDWNCGLCRTNVDTDQEYPWIQHLPLNKSIGIIAIDNFIYQHLFLSGRIVNGTP